jgi:hypothetical protein
MPLIVRWFESNFGGHISPMRILPWELEMITEEWASRAYDTRDTPVQDVIRGSLYISMVLWPFIFC